MYNIKEGPLTPDAEYNSPTDILIPPNRAMALSVNKRLNKRREREPGLIFRGRGRMVIRQCQGIQDEALRDDQYEADSSIN